MTIVEPSDEAASKLTHTRSKRRRVLIIFALPVLVALLCAGGLMLYRATTNHPPGFRDFFDSGTWNRAAIARFLGFPLPDDAQNLTIEGKQGLVGSDGIIPRLSFSFDAPPESAQAFVANFCDGVLHAGYDPSMR